jgi:hypothetical protein
MLPGLSRSGRKGRVSNCNWSGCLVPLAYGGRGRPPEYCPEHAGASKQALDKARPDYGRARKRYDGCCLDAHAAGVRSYGAQTVRYQDWDPRHCAGGDRVRAGRRRGHQACRREGGGDGRRGGQAPHSVRHHVPCPFTWVACPLQARAGIRGIGPAALPGPLPDNKNRTRSSYE